jgi:hypothetical protein
MVSRPVVQTFSFFCLGFFTAFPLLGQNRLPDYVLKFPEGCLIQQGGRVYNVKNPPANEAGVSFTNTAAIGDGVADDTTALRDAYDYLKRRWRNEGQTEEVYIYLPNGTYRVSDTITYYGPTPFDRPDRNTQEGCSRIRFVGESRTGTVIQLRPNAATFGNVANPKVVLAYSRPDCVFNADNSRHECRNLTVDVANNVGAIGIDYWAANGSDLSNVSVRANEGAGAIGIHCRIACMSGYLQDVTVTNFAYGIKLDGVAFNESLEGRASYPVFEHVTLRGQRTASISIGPTSAVFRKLRTESVSRPVELTSNSSQLILLDSTFATGSSANTAVTVNGSGHFFGRKITSEGYGSTVRINNRSVLNGNVTEYSNYALKSTRGNTSTLNLPIKDIPVVAYPTVASQWVAPASNTQSAIQAAFNSNKPVVYLPAQSSYSAFTATVPPAVKRVVGFYQDLTGELVISQDSPDPLIVEDTRRLKITNNSNRKVILRNAQLCDLGNNGTAQEWQLCNIGSPRFSRLSNSSIWCRWLNMEGSFYPDFRNNNRWVVLGYKTERHEQETFRVRGTAQAEILGATFGVVNDDSHLIVESGAKASLVGNDSGNYATTMPAVVDGSNSISKESFYPRKPVHWFYIFSAF